MREAKDLQSFALLNSEFGVEQPKVDRKANEPIVPRPKVKALDHGPILLPDVLPLGWMQSVDKIPKCVKQCSPVKHANQSHAAIAT